MPAQVRRASFGSFSDITCTRVLESSAPASTVVKSKQGISCRGEIEKTLALNFHHNQGKVGEKFANFKNITTDKHSEEIEIFVDQSSSNNNNLSDEESEDEEQLSKRLLPISDATSLSTSSMQVKSVDSISKLNVSESKESNLEESQPLDMATIWDAVLKCDLCDVLLQVKNGADPDEMDDEGRTPLMVACAQGAAHIVRYLVNDAKPKVNIESRAVEGWTPLMIACMAGHLEVVKILIESGASLFSKDTASGSTPLIWACSGGHFSVVRYIFEESVNDFNRANIVQERNFKLWTPLMVAADCGHNDIVRYLASQGAQLDNFNDNGNTALDLATESGNMQIEAFLRRAKARTSRDFWAALIGGDLETVCEIFLTNPHMNNLKDKHERTPLILACLQNDFEMAKFLCSQAGINVNSQDSTGTTALDIVALNGNIDLACLLVNIKNINLEVKNKSGWTPLMQAIPRGTSDSAENLKMLRILVDAGAEVNCCNFDGQTVLDVAINADCMESAKYLASKGAFSSDDVKKQISLVSMGKRGGFKLW